MHLLNICLVGLLLVQVGAGRNFYSFDVRDIYGEETHLKDYIGKVTLVVNVASHCGYTESTYKALVRIHDILSYSGYFSVLAFPCNQFGEQESGEIDEIVENIVSEYGAEFPIFDKVDVIGPNASPAFQYLTEQSSVAPDWNFYKYLVDGEGHVLNAWGTRTSIEEIFEEVQTAVNKAEKKSKQPIKKKDEDDVSNDSISKDEL